MKKIIIDAILGALHGAFRYCLPRRLGAKAFTYKKKDAVYFVGYWNQSGEFNIKAEVQTETEAKELCALLNRQCNKDL